MVMRALLVVIGACIGAFSRTATATAEYDVLVYGSTPSGIVAAVAAARHGANTALLSQREHIGGVCSGGLGQTDIGSCATEVIGGIPLEFFNRNAKSYTTQQPRSPWNLEPHVAKEVFLNMLHEAGVTLIKPVSEVLSVSTNGKGLITNITVVAGTTYNAKVFIDASYEGDLMARTHGVSYTWGRESREQYNESGAGSQLTPQVTANINPFDAKGELLSLLNAEPPFTPAGQEDKGIQAYNFRICVTNNDTIRVPFEKPAGYNPQYWELLRRFWLAWPNSTNPEKEAQAKVPSAILGSIPSTTGARKYDMNNCGYNPIHTDMIGGSWSYPEADYATRKVIWEAHVNYTKGFLWFMSSDSSVPWSTRQAYANDWGYCGDEFAETDHFPPQLYVREARRLVGDKVLTQNDVLDKTSIGNLSIGMGCYNFDSHCEERYACNPKTNPECTDFNKTYVAVECSCGIASKHNPGTYQMSLSLLFPKRAEVSNLLVPVCNSASHVAYATVRMEPQFMIIGHAAGVVAALTVKTNNNERYRDTESDTFGASASAGTGGGGGGGGGAVAVQDVNPAAVRALLKSDGALLDLPPPAPPAPLGYSCVGEVEGQQACLQVLGKHTYTNASCNGRCTALGHDGWVLLKEHWKAATNQMSATVTASAGTFIKKSEAISGSLPPASKREVSYGTVEHFTTRLISLDAFYWLANLASPAVSSA